MDLRLVNTQIIAMKSLMPTLFILACTMPVHAAPASLDTLLTNPETWNSSPNTFMQKAAPLGFEWGSEARDSARCVAPGRTFLNEPVLETVVRFHSNSLAHALLSLYNRGDAGDMELAAFQSRFDRIADSLTAMAGARGKPVTTTGPVRVNIKTVTLSWSRGGLSYILESSWTRSKEPLQNRTIEKPEYINLTLLRTGAQAVNAITGPPKVGINLALLRKMIKKNDAGDVYLENVPMVDQGEKGYCAVATTERVMRYYGAEINQHELAQKAMTATGGGTSPDALLKALKAMAGILNVRIAIIENMSLSDINSMVQNYNRFAKKTNDPEIVLPKSGLIDLGQIFNTMNKATFIQMRTSNPGAIERFTKSVREKISAGLPLAWSVMMGFVTEEPAVPQASGGHVRLIIGYNDKTSEILYSDSWGRGHELKRMKRADAFAITTGLFTIEPLR